MISRPFRIVWLVLFLIRPSVSSAQEAAVDSIAPSVSIGIRAGYGWGIGDWTRHRYAPVDHLKPTLTYGGDLEIPLSYKVGLGLSVDYTRLDTGAWEEYAASQESFVKASASLINAGISIRPYLRRKAPSYVKLEIGAFLSFGSGQEVSEYSYQYDFLGSPCFGMLLGLEYEYLLSSAISFTIKGAFVFIPSGVSYADKYHRDILTAPVTGGFRIYM
ncbi:MAG: hypothetical protein OEV30_13600 [Ignavibacteria bacterium]|nr:hypothetical protein [Ignavibacteria bacterium]